MSANDEYKAAYDLTEINAKSDDLRKRVQDARSEYETRWQEERQKLLANKKKKGKDLTPDGETMALEILKKYDLDQCRADLEQAKKDRQAKLDVLVKDVTIEVCTQEMHKLEQSSDGTFSTQTNPTYYAEQSLVPSQAKLEQLGFKTEIRRVEHGFELYANCEPWQFDAIMRRFTIDEALQLLKAKSPAANPFVLFPSLQISRPDLLSTYWK